MFEAAIQAFGETFSPPLRKILFKSLGLALLLLVVLGMVLQGVITHLVALPYPFDTALAIISALGLIAGAVYLVPPITSLVASLFFDDIADQVERRNFPNDTPGKALPIATSTMLSIRFFGLVLLVNLLALLLLIIPGVNLIAFFAANAYLLGREYFELAAMRFRPIAEARALRKENAVRVFLYGMVIAAIVFVPILNLITPVFATAFMVRMHKRIAAGRGPRTAIAGAAPVRPVSPASDRDR
jgi:CysZ protein